MGSNVRVRISGGHTDPGVSQTPSHRITEVGQGVTLGCDPISGHIFVYWYRQNLRHEMEFLISFQYQNIAVKSGMPKERFSAERPTGTYSTLMIQPLAEPGDSAVYFCASSLSTPMQSHILPKHKRPAGPAPETDQGWGRAHGLISERISSEAFCRVRMEIGEDRTHSTKHPSPCSQTKTATRER
uniref:Ig-like domain-containing protein n=1 Tax=Rhinolophus ferrumequinum TaxID=59479 RepID=A0A671EMR1_RHIFE